MLLLLVAVVGRHVAIDVEKEGKVCCLFCGSVVAFRYCNVSLILSLLTLLFVVLWGLCH